mgnify:FL=1
MLFSLLKMIIMNNIDVEQEKNENEQILQFDEVITKQMIGKILAFENGHFVVFCFFFV